MAGENTSMVDRMAVDDASGEPEKAVEQQQ